jgi:hypothetical protein
MTSLLARLRSARVHDTLRAKLGEKTVILIQRGVAPVFRRSLTALAIVYWSDKAGGHKYTSHYERHFRHLRKRPVRLLEIGIGGYDSPTWGGASLRTWRDYFRRGEIHGLDIYEKRIAEPRIHVHKGDQSDGDFLRRLGDEYGPFDVIIDDGSHINAHVRASFNALFSDYLTPGGFYVIEDLETAYDPAYGGGDAGHPGTSVELVKAMVDEANVAPRRITGVHVYRGIAFIEKGTRG